MGWIFSGDGDVNVTGVVGSQGRDDSDSETNKDRGEGKTNEGIIHSGRGEVWVNGKRQ